MGQHSWRNGPDGRAAECRRTGEGDSLDETASERAERDGETGAGTGQDPFYAGQDAGGYLEFVQRVV